jgi:dienelactone hydrolase
VPRLDVTVPAADGDCAATLHLPDGTGPWPAVLLYPDAGGVRDTFLAMADRMSGLGYATLLPDVYYRSGPYRQAGAIRGTVYVAAAENDASCPPEQLARLEKALAEAGVRHTIETYPAAHGFAVPDNPTYDQAADERHWSALERLYQSALRP